MGIDVEVMSVNAYWYDMDRDLAARFIDAQNAKLAEMTQGRDGRFYAMATVAMQHPDLAARQLEDAVRRRGLRGVSPAAPSPGRNWPRAASIRSGRNAKTWTWWCSCTRRIPPT